MIMVNFGLFYFLYRGSLKTKVYHYKNENVVDKTMPCSVKYQQIEFYLFKIWENMKYVFTGDVDTFGLKTIFGTKSSKMNQQKFMEESL